MYTVEEIQNFLEDVQSLISNQGTGKIRNIDNYDIVTFLKGFLPYMLKRKDYPVADEVVREDIILTSMRILSKLTGNEPNTIVHNIKNDSDEKEIWILCEKEFEGALRASNKEVLRINTCGRIMAIGRREMVLRESSQELSDLFNK
ncbi:MAG: hypothetical protein WAZ18_01805 [Alphaproteobacteria bacterium]